jgi:tRNA threonylcarbamoyladenosine biosynthesis protein TsaB
MLAVALETSTRPASLAVEYHGTRRATALEHERAHASDLLPTLAEIVAAFGARPQDIDAVLVGTGPGSHTGLRVGIATALGLARGADARIVGVPSGEVLVHAELCAGEEAAVVLDARQGELYFAHYLRTDTGVDVLRAPCVLRPDELVRALPRDAVLLCDPTVPDIAGITGLERVRTGRVPHASALLELGLARLREHGGQTPEQVAPLYLRPFAAKPRKR